VVDALEKLLAMAVKPTARTPKPKPTFSDKFKSAIERQHENLMKADRPPSKTDWFQRVGDVYHVRLGRKKIGLPGPDGKDKFYFEAANVEQVNQIFLLAAQLLEENEDFRNKVLEQYGSEDEMAALSAQTEKPKRRGRKPKSEA